MPKLQNFAVPRNNDTAITVLVDSDIAGDSLAGATVEWSVYAMSFAVPDQMTRLIVKDNFDVGGITAFESPPMTFVIDLAAVDTAALDLGNFYHEALLVDNEGHRSTVLYGAMAVTLSLSNGVAPPPAPAPTPVNTIAPVVTGTGVVGQTLGCSQGTWSNSPTSYAYQWRRNGTNIGGATLSNYVLVSADGGTSVACVVTATNANGSTPATSNTVAVAVPVSAPINTVLPAITVSGGGSAYVGSTLNCSAGTWTGSPTFTYQWQRDGVNIGGATATTYRLVIGDGAHSISCLVTGTNASGNATAASNAVAVPTFYVLPAGASAVWSLRAYSAASYTANKCVRVQRFSDGAQQDIGFNAYGIVDMVAAATFAGGSLLYLMKWYDQSGNGADASAQVNAAYAPQFVNLNGPQIAFGALNTLTTPAAISLTGDQTMGMFMQLNGCAVATPLACWDTTHGWAFYLNGNGAGTVDTIFDGAIGPLKDTSNLLAGSLHQVVITRASGAGKVYVDGVQTATGATSNGTSTNPVSIGSYNSNTWMFNGLLSEVYLYSSALAAATVTAINTNEVALFPQTGFQNYYNGSCAIQTGSGQYLTFGDVLNYEYTQPWTMYAALQMYGVNGGAEAGIGADIDHGTGPVFRGYLTSILLPGAASLGGIPPGAIVVRLIHDLNANIHVMGETTTAVPIDGAYHLVAVTYTGSGTLAGFKVYVDGNLLTLSNISDNLAGTTIVAGAGVNIFSVGCQANDGGNFVNGRVGFFQMDKVAQSAIYIQNNFSAANPGPPPNVGGTTAIRLMMNEGSGTTVNDTSGNGLNGTLTSAGMWAP